MATEWFIYQQAARKVIADMRQLLGIETVEGERSVRGKSGATWKLDATAWMEGSDGFLIVEARRHTTERLKQEAVAAVAYRIQDVGAAGGMIVSPLPMQKGAARVAAGAEIAHIMLTPDSTPEDYLAEYMGRRFLGATVREFARAQDVCDARRVHNVSVAESASSGDTYEIAVIPAVKH